MRRFGSRDKRQRKRRADIGKRRKFYKGKSVRKRRTIKGFTFYLSKRDKNDPLKLWFWREEPMSLEGYKRFPRRARIKVRKIVYRPILRMDVPPQDMNTKEKIEALAEQHLWDGDWHLKMFSYARNKFHSTNRTVATIRIRETSEGLKARLTPSYKNRGLYRYWFWRG